MLLNDEKQSVIRGHVVTSHIDVQNNEFIIFLKVIQNGLLMDYSLRYKSSEKRDIDYRKICKHKKI